MYHVQCTQLCRGYSVTLSSPAHLLITGDIGALAGSWIQGLNLWNCKKLTGKSAVSFVWISSVAPGKIFVASQPSLHCTTSGSIEVLKDMPIKELNLESCFNLTGECVEFSLLIISVLPQGNT